jgi:hypothetical protein
MQATNFDLSSLAAFIYSGAAVVALLLLLQACGIDLAKHVNSLADKISARGKVSRTRA